jgi:hypothetical protein
VRMRGMIAWCIANVAASCTVETASSDPCQPVSIS